MIVCKEKRQVLCFVERMALVLACCVFAVAVMCELEEIRSAEVQTYQLVVIITIAISHNNNRLNETPSFTLKERKKENEKIVCEGSQRCTGARVVHNRVDRRRISNPFFLFSLFLNVAILIC